MAYYVLKYAFTVYTSLLYTGGFIIADFLDSFIVFLYCILSIYVIDITGKKKKAEHLNSSRSLVQRKYIRLPVFWCVTTAERTIVARSQKQAQPGCAEHSIHLVKRSVRLNRYRSLPYSKSLLMSWVRIILRTSGFATEFSIFVSAMIML